MAAGEKRYPGRQGSWFWFSAVNYSSDIANDSSLASLELLCVDLVHRLRDAHQVGYTTELLFVKGFVFVLGVELYKPFARR